MVYDALQALAFDQLGQQRAVVQASKQALAIGERAGYVRLVVDQGAALAPLLAQLPATPYRDKVLTAFATESPAIRTPHPSSSTSLANQQLIEPLSERELKVLRLVVADASNQEIANQLFITVGTVKNHMTNILGKLGVSNRRAAIRKTGELGLL
jgi:LuxR family maltose regulon positive regulatory protein